MRMRWFISAAVVVLLGAGAVVAAIDDGGDPGTSSVAMERPGPGVEPPEPPVERPDIALPTDEEARKAVGSGQGSGSGTGAAEPRPGLAMSGAEPGTAQSGIAAPDDPVAPIPPPKSPTSVGPRIDQKVVKTADLTVEVGKGRFEEAFREATGVAGLHGGFVATSNTNTRDGELAVGTLEIRVPSTSFEAARTALSKLGKVTDERISGQDVGAEIVDIEARLRSLAVEEDALRALMARARTVGETVEVQRQLTNVRQQIEQLTGQKARLDELVSMSTIRATVTEPGAAVVREEPSETSLARSFERAVDGTVAVVGGTIVVLGYILPLSALILFGWLLYRWTVRRHGHAVSG